MAKARRRPITPKSHRGKTIRVVTPRRKRRAPPAKSEPERPLLERLKDYPQEPLRLNLSPQQLAELRRQLRQEEARLQRVQSMSLQEKRRSIDRALAEEAWGPPPEKKHEKRKKRRRKGAPRESDHAVICAEAQGVVDEIGCPRSNSLLAEKTRDRCEAKRIITPRTSRWLEHITSPVFKRHKRHQRRV